MAYMQVEMFSQALHMAVGVDVILPQPVKNEIGLESGEKTDQKYPTLWLLHGATDDQTTCRGGHPSNDMWHLLDWQL